MMIKKISKVLTVAILATSINFTPATGVTNTPVAQAEEVVSGSAIKVADSVSVIESTPTNISKEYVYKCTIYYYNYDTEKYVITWCPITDEEDDKGINYKGKEFDTLDELKKFAKNQEKKYEEDERANSSGLSKYSEDAVAVNMDIARDKMYVIYVEGGCSIQRLPKSIKKGTKVTFKMTGKKACTAKVNKYRGACPKNYYNVSPRVRATKIDGKKTDKVFKHVYAMEKWEKKTGHKVNKYKCFEETVTIKIHGYGTYKVTMIDCNGVQSFVQLREK